MEKFVVTQEEVAGIPEPQTVLAPSPPPQVGSGIPLWARLSLPVLVLVLPILCLVAIITRVAFRSRPPRTRHLWDAYFCTLLIISGALFTGAMAFVVSTGVGTVPISAGLAELDDKKDFPQLPAPTSITLRELSKALKPLVVIASPPQKLWFRKELMPSGTIGTAFLLQADAAGYLFATARHVIDGESWATRAGSTSEVLLSTLEGGWSGARVVARNTASDVALLWIPRHEGQGGFCQPVMHAADISSGDAVFVIGHPEGMNFSLSTGIVSRLAPNRTLQISAPISPGNSGGPVYDSRGTLLAIVSYTFNKAVAPNAENLNFAVDADVLYDAGGWSFEKTGEEKLTNFKNVCGAARETPAPKAAQ